MLPPGPTSNAPYHSLAIASFVCSILCCFPLAPLVGFFLGWKANEDLKTVAAGQKGKELAIAGMALSGLGMMFQCISLLGSLA